MESVIKTVGIISSVSPQITFATHQNDIAVIASLSIQNLTESQLENLELSLTCNPPLIAPKVWKIDRLSPNGEIHIPGRDRAVSLDGGMLSSLTEKVKAELTLTVTQNGVILGEARQKITGLARNEWGGASHMPELLAAFVMPNDPAVSTVLKEAGEVLRRAGEQPALDGYQSKSRQRVWQMVSAIWAAISSRRIVYAVPPASFETEGQKVRNPSEIWSEGLATCLDTALLFASSLEQAGLNPIIIFTKGHAFCGCWLQPQQLQTLTTDDCTDIRKYISLKELVVFETTLVVNEPPLTLSKAIEAAEKLLSEANESEFIYALDVKRARREQITPLGSISKAQSGETTDSLLSLGLESAPSSLPSAFDLDLEPEAKNETPQTRLENWKRKLLDLTKRNRLLNLKPSKTAIKLYCPDPAKLEDKLADGKKISVIPASKSADAPNGRDGALFFGRTGDDLIKKFAEEALERNEVVCDMPQKDLDAGLVQLYRKAQADLQEGGANTLYLSIGILKWKEDANSTTVHRAPLILLPVKLDRKSAASKVYICPHEDEAVFNMTLLEMLRQDFDLRFPDLEGELPKDDSGIDVPLIWETVRKAVRDIPGFEVTEEVVLSTFSFSKYLMWKDLTERTEALKQAPLVKHLIENPREAYTSSPSFLKNDEIDKKIHPSELFMPLYADSSQIVAVHASGQTGDFILEGPPGTGKSQTIANIIAHNLALGRKVLFVAEKMPALDVVYQRLQEKNLGDFCLELHSNKANKRAVLDHLGRSWRNRLEHTPLQWHEEALKLKAAKEKLNHLVETLHEPSLTGVSPRAAMSRSAKWKKLHRLELNWGQGLESDKARDKAGLLNLEEIAKKLGQTYSGLDAQDKQAFVTLQNTEWSNAWQSGFVDSAQKLAHTTKMLMDAYSQFSKEISLPISEYKINRITGLAKVAKSIPAAAQFNLNYALEPNRANIFNAFDGALDELKNYENQKNQLSCKFTDIQISSANVGVWENEYAKATKSFKPINFIQSWLLAKKIKKQLGLVTAPNLANDLPVLEHLQTTFKTMMELASELPAETLWKGLNTNPEKAQVSLTAAKLLGESLSELSGSLSELPAMRTALKQFCVEGREMLQPGMPLARLAESLASVFDEFKAKLDEYLIQAQSKNEFAITEANVLLEQLEKIIALQPRINAWCRWQAAKKDAEAKGLECLVWALETGTIEPLFAEEAFKTAYCSWLAPRLIDSREELRTFSALEHEEAIHKFRELDDRLSKLSVDYIKAKLSANIPLPTENKRPEGYGLLNRELQKQRAHKPIRQLIEGMGDSLTSLTPCLLMSPLSIAQFLSADSSLFDLVVFDEASQITVWDAIGAIARGKNVIIVGDPKQMPPTNFFDRVSPEENTDEESTEEDLESILDEGLAASVKLHRLTGHYRSRHESLIAFSNHRYYDGELVTYPSSDTRDSAVSFRQIPGIYQRGKGRTNPEEAQAVVAEVMRRLKDSQLSKLSIGIVTLNSEQQQLIENLLDEKRRLHPWMDPFFSNDITEPLFVKNLESVQGNQRDVILISIGYGPDTPGAQTMSMNFGPLNRKGGERRLNVAITRATSEVVVFASFDPALIDLTRTSAKAVHDLKHYLDFAKRGPVALGQAIWQSKTDGYDSDFEEAVAEELRSRGWSVHTQIGVSKFRIDLGIIHPNKPGVYLAGIECDGATYHSSPSARDRDRVRHAILENLGWSLIRLWSTDFYIDSNRAIETIHTKLLKLLEDDTTPAKNKPLEAHIEVLDFDNAPQEGVIETELSEHTNKTNLMLSPQKFYDKSYQPTLTQLAHEFIDEYGPITFSHLCEKIARAHGFQRTGPQIKSTVLAGIENTRQTNGHGEDIVFWPEKIEPKDILDFRGMALSGNSRSWKDVPLPEKLGLVQHVLSEHNENAAPLVMASHIGISRIRAATKQELESLISKFKQLDMAREKLPRG